MQQLQRDAVDRILADRIQRSRVDDAVGAGPPRQLRFDFLQRGLQRLVARERRVRYASLDLRGYRRGRQRARPRRACWVRYFFRFGSFRFG